VNSNIAVGSLPTLQTSHGLLALFEKDLLWRADLYRLLKYQGGCSIPLVHLDLHDVKRVLQSDTIALLGNNYSLQIIETGFAEQFYASHRMGPPPICL
jgi:hypothetical protein